MVGTRSGDPFYQQLIEDEDLKLQTTFLFWSCLACSSCSIWCLGVVLLCYVSWYPHHHLSLFFAKITESIIKIHQKYKSVSNIVKLHRGPWTTERPLPSPEGAADSPLLPLSYPCQLDLLDDSWEVFMHVPLETNTSKPQSSPFKPWIDMKNLTPNLVVAYARWEIITSSPRGAGRNLRWSFV